MLRRLFTLGGFSNHLCCHKTLRQTNALRLVLLKPAWACKCPHRAQLAVASGQRKPMGEGTLEEGRK